MSFHALNFPYAPGDLGNLIIRYQKPPQFDALRLMGRWLGPEDGRGTRNRNRVFHVEPLKLGGYSLGHDLLSHASNMAWRRLGATGANPP